MTVVSSGEFDGLGLSEARKEARRKMNNVAVNSTADELEPEAFREKLNEYRANDRDIDIILAAAEALNRAIPIPGLIDPFQTAVTIAVTHFALLHGLTIDEVDEAYELHTASKLEEGATEIDIGDKPLVVWMLDNVRSAARNLASGTIS